MIIRIPRVKCCGCLPPAYGPSMPNAWSRWMNFRRETGGSLGTGGRAKAVQIQVADLGDFEVHPQPQGDPVAQRLP
jgi:hypothetical protein